MDPGLLAYAVTMLETLNVSNTWLTQQKTEVILTIVCKENKMAKLYLSWNNLSGVDPGLLVMAVSQLKFLNIKATELFQQQTVVLLSTISVGSKLTTLNIKGNDLLGVDPGLLATVIGKLKYLNVKETKLTQQQIVAILTSISEKSKIFKLSISVNNLS